MPRSPAGSSLSIRSMSSTACAGGEVLAVGDRERVAVALEERAARAPRRAARRARRGGRPSRRGSPRRAAPRSRRRRTPGPLPARCRRRSGGGPARTRRRASCSRRSSPPNASLRISWIRCAVLGVEAIARQVDEAGEEAAERVAADEEPNALPLAEVEDPERDLEELVLRDLEELVARVRLEDLDERLVVVAALRQARALDHPLRLAAEDRDLPRARAVGGVRVEAEEAPLAGDLAGGVEALDADVVEVRGPVHGRARVRLRQVEEVLLPREPPHLRRQLREAGRDRPLVARRAGSRGRSPARRGGRPPRPR